MTNNSNPRYSQKFLINIQAPSQEVFSYICETKDQSIYSSGKSEIVYSLSGLAEDNCIFKTVDSKTQTENLWLISSFDPDKEIQFVKQNEICVCLIKVTLSELQNSYSSVEVQYSITYLTKTNINEENIKTEVKEEINRLRDYFINKFYEVK